LTETEVAAPSNQIDGQLLNNLLEAASAYVPRQFPRLCFEASKLTVNKSKSGVVKTSARKFLGFRFIGGKACPLTVRVLLQKTPPLLLHALGTETVFESQQRFLSEERG
jgi:hypothetical protein